PPIARGRTGRDDDAAWSRRIRSPTRDTPPAARARHRERPGRPRRETTVQAVRVVTRQGGPEQHEDADEADDQTEDRGDTWNLAVREQRVDAGQEERRGGNQDGGKAAGHVLLRPVHAAVAETEQEHALHGEVAPRLRSWQTLAPRVHGGRQ